MKWARETAGLASATCNQVVCRVREGAKRILGARRPNRKEPLSVEVLKKLWKELICPTFCGLETCVCACYPKGFFFFRSEEVLNIGMNHIRFCEGYT